MPEKFDSMFSVYVDSTLKDILTQIASERGISMAQVCRDLILLSLLLLNKADKINLEDKGIFLIMEKYGK
jgi:hypothetical protein